MSLESEDQAAQDALAQAAADRFVRTERQKMLAGEPYLAMTDADLTNGRLRTRPLLQAFNNAPWPRVPEDPQCFPTDFYGPERRAILEELFGLAPGDIARLRIEIEPQFACDYGVNITFTGPFYANFGCIILDCAKVSLGSNILFAPDVHIYAATHSVDVAERRAGLERAYPVTIGNDVWVGGGCRIIGPCVIGDGVTLAAGSIAKGTLEPYCVYGGIPARLLRRLERPVSNEETTK